MNASAVLRVNKLTGPLIVAVAAKHNKRADPVPKPNIDPTRSHLNESITPSQTYLEIAQTARDKMAMAYTLAVAEAAAAGKRKPNERRKDAVVALEFLVSLPVDHGIDEGAFFRTAASWIATRYGGTENLLSADIHRDEGAPHLHVLILPLIDRRMNGSAAVGPRGKMIQLQQDFSRDVGELHGLPSYSGPRRGDDQGAAAALVLGEFASRPEAVMRSPAWMPIRDAFERDPAPFLAAFGLSMPRKPSTRTVVQIMTSKGKGTGKAYRLRDAETGKQDHTKPILCRLRVPNTQKMWVRESAAHQFACDRDGHSRDTWARGT